MKRLQDIRTIAAAKNEKILWSEALQLNLRNVCRELIVPKKG